MKRLTLLVTIALALAAAVACGGDDDSSPDDGGSSPGFSSGVGPGISLSDALSSDLSGPLLINGFLVIQGGEQDNPEEVRLCEALAESFPPQCSGRSLVVEGLDLKSIDGITSEGAVSWSARPVQILGSVEGEILTVSSTTR